MTWVRLDDAMPLHPKVLPLTDAAFRAHVEAICHCARSLTDGHVAAKVAKAHHWTKRAPELVEAGLWEPLDDGWLVHDYLDFNPSREQVEAERLRKSAAGRLGGKRSAEARAQASAEAPAWPVLAEPPNPVPSRPGREVPTELPREIPIARARGGPRLVRPNLTQIQSSVLDALHEQVSRLVFGGSDAPPTGWCEDLVTRGATLADVSHAVQRTLENGVHGNGTLRYVATVLEGRVAEREQGRDPDAHVNAGAGSQAASRRSGSRAVAAPDPGRFAQYDAREPDLTDAEVEDWLRANGRDPAVRPAG